MAILGEIGLGLVQCFGSGLDLDSIGPVDLDQTVKNDKQKKEKVKKFYVLKCWMFSLVDGELNFCPLKNFRILGHQKPGSRFTN